MLACAYSMIWITFVSMDDAGGHRLGSTSLFMQEGTAPTVWKNILPTPQTHWLNSTIFPEWFGTLHFSSQCLWEPEDTAFQEARQQQSAAGNSWLSQTSPSDLPAAGSDECHSKAALSLAPVPSLWTLLYFRVNALSQNKVYVGKDAVREIWT